MNRFLPLSDLPVEADGQFPNSWYAATLDDAAPASQPPPEGDITCDVVIVGGGNTGCSAALHLARQGFSVRLLEGAKIGFGASGRNGGQVHTGFGRGMAHAERTLGQQAAQDLWDMSCEAVSLTRSLIKDHQIDCQWQDGTVLLGVKPGHKRDLEAAAHEWSRYGFNHHRLLDQDGARQFVNSGRTLCGLYENLGGHLHPLKYVRGLARAAIAAGAIIHENTPMLHFSAANDSQKVTVKTAKSTINDRWLMLCGNAYLWGGKIPALKPLSRKVIPLGTYIIATEDLGTGAARLMPGNACAADEMNVLSYFRRSPDNRLLFGGRARYSSVESPAVAERLRQTMLAYFPQLDKASIAYHWGGYVAMTADRYPQLGRLANDRGQPANILFAQGFSGHGVALTGLTGKLMAEMVAGQESRFDLMARIPHLSIPAGRYLRRHIMQVMLMWHRLKDLL